MLKFRWDVASGGAQHPFTEDAIRVVHRHSEGMPREANILADNALLLGYYKDERTISAELVDQVAADRRANLTTKEAA